MINIVKNFNDDVKKVINFIEADRLEEARRFFNDVIFKKYGKYVRDKESPLVFFEIFFTELDEYLNSEGARISGSVSKDEIIGSYYSDYQEDLKLAIEKEKNKG